MTNFSSKQTHGAGLWAVKVTYKGSIMKRIEIAERDLKIFSLIKKMGWVRQDNIALFLGLDYSDSKVNNVMRGISFRLQKYGYIFKKKFLNNEPTYWTFDKTGAAIYHGIAQPKFLLQNIRHDDLVTKLLISYIHQDIDIKTEFELKQELSFDKVNRIKLPDLIINQKTAVEIELTQKSLARIRNIISGYRNSNYEQIIYYTTPKIARIISEVICGNSRFKIKLINENDILNSIDFIDPKYGFRVNKLDEERRQLKTMLGLD